MDESVRLQILSQVISMTPTMRDDIPDIYRTTDNILADVKQQYDFYINLLEGDGNG